MDDQVGEARLLERRLECLDELMGKLADEADRVGHEVAAPLVLVGASGRVERVEELRADAHARAGQRIEERRLARVRVAGERDCGDGRGLAACSHGLAPLLHVLELSPERRDPVASEAAVGLDLGLARAPGADAAVHSPGTESLEVRPQPAHAREVVFELRELDLELALGRVRVVGEDVQNHRGAVDHRDVERGLEVSLLPGRQLVVAGNEVRA